MLYSLGPREPLIKEGAWVADNAALIGSVILEKNANVWFNCTLRGDNDDLIVGENSNVQDGSVLHTDPGLKLRIGRDCTIGHLVMLHGCDIGDNTLIGIKSVVLNRARIGKNCIVGANSLVTEGKVFPDNSMIMGAPAKVTRELTPQEVQVIKMMSMNYVQNALRYQTQLKALCN
ncbi:gamma carbonic anhydrase family protein [Stenotrophobium rhamnosiphilum]|uniref:Gamma carbonic anhydrase family protein n=1 Tax=Stenotrophobium rhamnosiphilum TaxID=2029166 RepID=A0A2T5MHL9_9GAMM|nr:gamma carbonic anhydrase family protein [Stenotrophobium rhamnosiphilum]PTU32075.1 gamma carbonic anhydrase family protein [Stenotrophobium rhamnosiphilum]